MRGVIAFLIVPAILTIYFITIYVAAAMGAEWALSNPTYVHMTSWFLLIGVERLVTHTLGSIGVNIVDGGALVQRRLALGFGALPPLSISVFCGNTIEKTVQQKLL